ncbi:MAG TPA: DUF4102 domain-containing protein [Aeromonadales bacterium]|nr:DUF4102 domain-containing protein [Aeromonadales bacterium]
MGLTSTGIKALKPKDKKYRVTDGQGLMLEISPSGKKRWLYRFTQNGKRKTLTIGHYPAVSLSEARKARIELEGLIQKGLSPKKKKLITLKEFGENYYNNIVIKDRKKPEHIRRYLLRDIYPALGDKEITKITTEDILAIIEVKKKKGSDAVALQLRNLMKRIFEYAISQQLVTHNPALAIAPKYIFKSKSRDRALSPDEIRSYLLTLYQSNITRSHKLALHLILITLVRKGELVNARWKDINSDIWQIPKENSKNGLPHTVYLSTHAVRLFDELKKIAGNSEWVLPSNHYQLNQSIAEATLNRSLSTINFEIPRFTIHDSRRTASTLLHEAGFSSDVIEKSLNHQIKGIRGVYNKAEYADQRKEMLQFWGDYVHDLMNEQKVILANFG